MYGYSFGTTLKTTPTLSFMEVDLTRASCSAFQNITELLTFPVYRTLNFACDTSLYGDRAVLCHINDDHVHIKAYDHW